MPLFSAKGLDAVYEVEDTPEAMQAMKDKGYQPYVRITGDGQNYYTIPAEMDALKQAQEKGYKTEQEWNDLQQIRKDSKVQYSGAEAFGQGAVEQLTMGFSDELGAALAKGSYGKNLEAQRYLQKEAERQQPTAKMAGEVTGAIATGFLTPGVGATKTVAQAVGKGMISGGIQNALQSYGESEATTLGEQAKDVAVGFGKGAVLGGIGGALTRPAEAAAKVGEVTEKVAEAARPITQEANALARQLVYAGKEGGKTSPAFWIFPPAYKAMVVAKTLNALKETRGDYKQYKGIVNGFREELGDVAKQFDDDTLFSLAISQEGMNPAKEYLADLVTKNQPNVKASEVLDYLVQKPELGTQVRRASLVNQGKQLTDDFSKAYNDLYSSVKQNYEQALERAKPQFEKQGTEVQDAMVQLFTDLKKSKASAKYTDELQRAYHSLTSFQTSELAGDVSSPEVQKAAKEAWDSLSPGEQFDRLTEARKYLEDIYKGKPTLSTDDRKIYEMKKLVSGVQKSASAKAEADVNYKAFFDLKDRLDELKLTPDDLTQGRVRSMIKGTEKGTELTNELSLLKRELEESALDPSQRELITDQIDHILKAQDLLGKEKELVGAVKRLASLSKEDMQRIAATAGRKSTLSEVSRDLTRAGGLSQELEQAAQATHQKSFNELSKLEQLRLVGQIKKGPKK